MSRDPARAIVRPLVIVGAPRSGTNMLRDALASLPGTTTWPCDELPLLWRYRNHEFAHDELPTSAVTPEIQRVIRRAFARRAVRDEASVVVEKTCANSLRVPFVHRILPEASYVFLVRDGRDAVTSAIRRWNAPAEPVYLLRKARFSPPTELLRRAVRTVGRAMDPRPVHAQGVGWWGPVPAECAAHPPRDLLDAAAVQWTACVNRAADDLQHLFGSRPTIHVRYEEFVQDPITGLATITDKLGLTTTRNALEGAAEPITGGRVGAWRDSDVDSDRLHDLLHPTLQRFGYELPSPS